VATDTKAVYWADLGRKASSTRPADPSLDGFSYANGTISELSYSGNVVTAAETAVPIIPGVVPNNGSASVLFQYWRFNPSYDPNADPSTPAGQYYSLMTQPIADADLSDIVRVTYAYKTYPRKSNASDATTAKFSDQVNLRTADYANAEAPAC
jgi:hypothetical protein